MARHIYVHNPFCARKCPYCDFYSVTQSSSCEAFYLAAIRETGLIGSVITETTGTDPVNDADGRDTVYFGGGTPSLPDSRYICSLLEVIRRTFNISPDAEMTIEVNPSSADPGKLNDYRRAGFNRISLGVQSLDDNVLKTLGRLHDANGALKAIELIRTCGFENISADLITGVPGETSDGIKHDVKLLFDHGIKHISTYSLSIEEGTPFFERYGKTLEDIVPQEEERAMYHGTRDYLQSLGYDTYEISNSCLPGYKSIHNSSYWNSCEYFAIGAGAHGFVGDMRYGHKDNVTAYIEEMNKLTPEEYGAFLIGNKTGLKSLYVEEKLSKEDRMREVPFLRLRTTEGILLDEFYKMFGVEFDAVFDQAVKRNVERGYLELTKRTLRLTRSGLDYANNVIEDFL